MRLAPLTPEVFALNRLIRATQARLDDLTRHYEDHPSSSLAVRIEAQEREVKRLMAKHPDYR